MSADMSTSLRSGVSKATKILERRRNDRIRHARNLIEQTKAQDGAEASLMLCRQSVARFPDSADLWYSYARVLIDTKRPDAALETLALALHHNPAHLMALEYFISLTRITQSGKRKHDVGPAMDALASVAGHQNIDNFGALDFLIPHGRSHAVAQIAKMGGSSLAVLAAKTAVDLEQASESGPSLELTRSDDQRGAALASVLLARGRYTHALQVVDQLDDVSVLWHALRRAARRALLGSRPDAAVPLLKTMKRVKPHDDWVTKQLAEFDESSGLTNYALTKRGFPLPSVAETRRYKPSPNKVLYTLHNALPFNSAGYATRTHGLLSGLNRSGYEVQGVTRLGYPYDMPNGRDLGPIPSEHKVDGVTYTHLSTMPGIEQKKPLYEYVQRYAASLEAYALNVRPQILHAASNHWNGLATVTAANRLGIPSVYEVRGLWEVTRGSRNPEWVDSGMYRMISRMEADAAQGATHVLTITHALRNELIRRGVDGAKISVVPNGVDTERFQPVDRDLDLAGRLGVLGKTVIGYIGSILDYEGLELLLVAAREMKTTRQDFHVLIVGDGAELERFKVLAGEYGIQDVVTFTGRVPHAEVEKYYSLVDIAPFPRLPLAVCEMVSPLKPFEAMAMGKAVVASDVAALVEIVRDGETGLLHTKGSATALRESLERLLDDPALRANLAAQALAWVRGERDWSHLATSVTDVYRQLAID